MKRDQEEIDPDCAKLYEEETKKAGEKTHQNYENHFRNLNEQARDMLGQLEEYNENFRSCTILWIARPEYGV